ncbi:MAG: PEP-CTERM sorting domain-containing protein [Verrucomicrobiaceae bacterium]|nr:MAG: PEP-CTERM sorting domain-containing protein [Verrucomicrobiaceae bacterium]
MKQWTTQAEKRLAEYLRDRAAREGLEGEDAAELRDDLARHIHEEAEQTHGETIGLMQLENLLGRLDAGYRPQPEKPVAGRKAAVAGGFWNWTFGVVLPLVVLLIEALTSFCGSVFFSPAPTLWHVAWIAAVPSGNLWLMKGSPDTRPGLKGAAAGFALLTALFYAVLFLPIIHFSIVAIIFLGLGLLPMTPLLSAVISWRIGRAARRESADPRGFRTGWRSGALAALLVMAALEGPAIWTRACLSAATAGGEEAETAVNRLRSFHSERTLLRACYETNRGAGRATDISGWIVHLFNSSSQLFNRGVASVSESEASRDVFFRVTGKPFNSMKPPSGTAGLPMALRGNTREEFEFDDHLGGDDVAIRLKHLDLADSRFDGHVDSVSRIGYGEWTMVFKNGSQQTKEARCQVRLPRDGRISRLTLWVNGEPREAAFSTVSKVKAAYKSVAVVQQRDPVLVNMVGPDTVMVQCFPVPARGEMKIRLGITAPLDNGQWELPHVIERNFGLAKGLGHAVWMQGDRSFSLTYPTGKSDSAPDGGGQSLSAELTRERLMEPGNTITMGLSAGEPAVVWCEDRFAKADEHVLVREPRQVTRKAAEKLVVVIDGSLSMETAKERVLKALAAQDSSRLQLILADDTARRVTLAELEKHRFTGGRDNEPALREGIRLARESGAPVVWLHGPQAVKVSRGEALLQLLERGTEHCMIHDVEAVAGPNRLTEAIFRTGCVSRGPSPTPSGDNLTLFLEDLMKERTETGWNWKRQPVADDASGQKVWDQLARLWASRAAEDPAMVPSDIARTELAARYQLVTPVSGAVVLETQQQYEDHGLTPADGDETPQIPSVPEPSTGMLVILTTSAALMRRRRSA